MRMKLLTVAIVTTLQSGMILADDGGSLADAFMAQCAHSQACGIEEMRDRGMDPAMLQMIEARMEGQCEAQLDKMKEIESQAASGPNADKVAQMKQCFLAMTQMSCGDLMDDPEIPECQEV